ncbi:CBS domain-containing protein [Actinoplanes sichuanensis]|uniref:CBS domain-containing protein n=1 Tax=Actinoplanes sichuanensis TaxID=512349 RepID=A0ABW4AL90_9ACTN|nr:CBS domain-containing protein [Actinoplanes sichuanensis]BEL05998.1 CBS domain-containing protein [Actinoplanes sichuanensis]
MKTWHVSDVMTADVVSAGPDTPYRDVVDLLIGRRINAVPVVDDDRRVLGVVSESDLLRKIEFVGEDEPRWFERRRREQHHKAAARTAGELMTAPAVTLTPGAGIRAAARLLDETGLKQLPVVDDLGRLVGIVTRSDLLKEHLRPDADIDADVRSTIDEVVLTESSAAVRTSVERGVVTLAGQVDRWSTKVLLARLVALVPGVVEVIDEVRFDFDDHKLVEPVPAIFAY